MYHLRPHHLLCIQHYVGRGYDEAFTEHMNQVTASLKEHPGQLILLAEGCDELCRACPNREEGHCNSPDKVDRMDGEVKRLCSIHTGDVYTWEELKALAAKEILSSGSFGMVCENCNWFELCSDIRKNKNTE